MARPGRAPVKRLIGIALLLVLCLLAWRVYSLSNERRLAFEKARRAERLATGVAAMPMPGSAPVAEGSPRGIGFGLTFAQVDAAPGSPSTQLNCHGEPRELARPHRDSCNPYSGDTSCRTVLPVACIQPATGTLGATQPTMGALLRSADSAMRLCVAELGAGWRMAEFHDGPGWLIDGARGNGLAGNTRYWVHINDQPGNCWDSPP